MVRLRVMRRNVDGLTYNAVASNRDVRCQLSTWKVICSHATDYSPCIYDLSIGQYWTRCEWPDLKLQGTDDLGHVTLTTLAPHIIFRSNAHVHCTHAHTSHPNLECIDTMSSNDESKFTGWSWRWMKWNTLIDAERERLQMEFPNNN